jgi:hypothetical protein
MDKLREYLISNIPPEFVEKWDLRGCSTKKEEKSSGPLEKSDSPIHSNFRLPITYLDPSDVHSLSPIVAQDLELTVLDSSSNSIYKHLFRPTNTFGNNMMPSWTQYYTTNTSFLEDTQRLISKIHQLPHSHSSCYPKYEPDNNLYVPDYGLFRNIWHDIKEDSFFLEKYGYLEWSMLAQFNENTSFLQCLSIINVISPLISLFLPLLFIILPFIILKIQQIPITFSVYLEVLKSVAKNHFIGKALMSMTAFSWDKAAYLAMTAGLYFLQIYQNVSVCYRFYRNMILINKHLVELREFVHHSIMQMDPVLDIMRNLKTYGHFHDELLKQCSVLKNIQIELSHIYPFKLSAAKFCESGYMLRCYYRLHTVTEYESALRYATGFEGYVDNLRGICANIAEDKISLTAFTTDVSGCIMVDQYYPPLVDESPVKNTVDLNKNMILSGPNKAGKTTILKTSALNIIFSQQIGCGFYSSARMCPYTHIHSYLNIPDTSARDSLFQAESRRCKDILDHIKKGASHSRHFCIFDELYSGTNPEEATKAGYAFLKYLSEHENVDFMLTTHYVKICKKFLKSGKVENFKMVVHVLENGDFDYTYQMKKGISKIKGAVRVMKDMEYPDEIIKGMM